jgi:hypothetical protein
VRYFTMIVGLVSAGAGVLLLWAGRSLPVGLSGIFFGGGCAAIAAWDIVKPSFLRTRHSAFVNRDNQNRTLVVKSDIAEFSVYALGCIGFTSVGVLMILMEKDVWVGFLTAGFFGPGALLILWQIIDPRPRLVIDSDGVVDRTLGIVGRHRIRKPIFRRRT